MKSTYEKPSERKKRGSNRKKRMKKLQKTKKQVLIYNN